MLLVLLWRELVRRPTPSLLEASVWVALAALNRLDLVLVFLPPLLVLARRPAHTRARRLRAALVVCLPVLVWALFFLIYYGSFVPNTAIAKLGSALPRAALLKHGLAYLLQPAWNDPLSLLLLLIGLPWGMARGSEPVRAFCAGAGAYIVYVIWVGGDFMAGRFLSVPILISVLSLVESCRVPRLSMQLLLFAVAAALETVPPFPIWASPPAPSAIAPFEWLDTCLDGVCDERAFYGTSTSFRYVLSAAVHPPHPWALRGLAWSAMPEPTRIAGAVGFRGFFAGPRVLIVDYWGIADPLLARLAPRPHDRPWKPGHLYRCVPLGYPEATRLGPASLVDPALRE